MTQTVFITGASSGYGKATALHFLRQGWNVVATMRRPDPQALGVTSDRLQILPLEVTDPDSVEQALDGALSAFGQIDALINNAGIGLASAVEATPEASIREVFETNTFAVFAICRAIIPVMREQGHGTIINVTSSTAIAPMPLVAVYAASKWAVDGFTESLAYELAPFGIRARLLEPGYGPTTSFATNGAARMDGLIPSDYAAFAQGCFGRLADYPTDFCSEADVAEAAFAAATENGLKLRFLAGPDTRMLADLRWSTSEEHYLVRMREMFEPAMQAAV